MTGIRIQETAIPLGKRKLWLLLLLSFGFVAMGFWLWGHAEGMGDLDYWRAKGAALACMIFFGICVPIFVFKLMDKRAGIVINEVGIYRMGLFSYHAPIRWEHITHLTETKVQRTRLLLIHVDNVEEVLAGMTGLSRWLQRAIISSTGTPYSLSSAALQWDFDDLRRIIETGIELQHERD